MGTGGADLDELLPEKGTVIKNGILTYSYEGGIVTNGYLNAHRQPGMEYVFDFVATRPISSPHEHEDTVMPSATLVPGQVSLYSDVAVQSPGEGAVRRRKIGKKTALRRKTKAINRRSKRRRKTRRRRRNR